MVPVAAPVLSPRPPTEPTPVVTEPTPVAPEPTPAAAAPVAARPRRAPRPARRPTSLERERRVLPEALAAPPPSSLALDPHPSAARSGQAELRGALAAHTETGPALTGGDIDANWESAYSTGDEAPGGDMPTPDQGVVDDIGRALGVQYAPDEELKGAEKVAERDRHRWELDPASSEDFSER